MYMINQYLIKDVLLKLLFKVSKNILDVIH